MRASDLPLTSWRKSGRSNGGYGDQTECVEVAELADQVAMRDSKDPAGPVLAVAGAEWQSFLRSVRAGEVG